MKKALLLFGLILSFLITTKTYAVYDFVISSPTPTSITTTMSVPVGTTSTFKLLLSKESFPQTYTSTTIIDTNPFGGSLTQSANTQGVVTWNIVSNIQPATKYFMRIVETPSITNVSTTKTPFYTTLEKTFTTASITIVPSTLVFDYNGASGTVLIKGTLDVAKNPYFRTYKTQIQYSKNPITKEDAFLDVYKTHETSNNEKGVADDGTFHLQLSNISPSVQYNIKQSITAGGQMPTEQNGGITIGTFKSGVGYTTSNPQNIQSDFEDRSYRLLAPFPGFTLFLDPDLCAEQAAAGNTGQLCDINDILNLAFKILIGAAAVLLVLRIMFEGYKYITTDIPGLKTSAKSHITEAVLGLLLALSSFLILNTINPKIVENSIDAGRLEIGVTMTEIDAASFLKITGETLKTKSEYIPIVEKIAKEEGVDACVVKATIQVESQWKASAIGCDENSTNEGVRSRKAFLESGIKLDSTPFTPTSNNSSSIKNNCSFDKDKASTGYGLDWRFSKGGGLMQVTLFPENYGTATWFSGVKKGGTYWNKRTIPIKGFETLLKVEDNIRKGT
ncbi:pilin, partial [Patescibacteria group bacterium]|nr:pilin [Patescibacteria group bacterium]